MYKLKSYNLILVLWVLLQNVQSQISMLNLWYHIRYTEQSVNERYAFSTFCVFIRAKITMTSGPIFYYFCWKSSLITPTTVLSTSHLVLNCCTFLKPCSDDKPWKGYHWQTCLPERQLTCNPSEKKNNPWNPTKNL